MLRYVMGAAALAFAVAAADPAAAQRARVDAWERMLRQPDGMATWMEEVVGISVGELLRKKPQLGEDVRSKMLAGITVARTAPPAKAVEHWAVSERFQGIERAGLVVVNIRHQSERASAEQLVAESTGKQGRGILPVAGEPLGDPEAYGEDRVFAYLRNDDTPDEKLDEAVKALGEAGHPTLTLATHGPEDLGRIFFIAEFATATAGWVLDINPFDQPNVQEAKDNTKRVLESGSLPDLPVAGDEELRALLGDAEPPHYVAIMGYLEPSPELDAAVADLRAAIRASTGAATTFGYGPRFLHSTGQLHKGGPPSGRFLQLVADPRRDAEIPGAGYSFATLIAGQAAGDLQTLRGHGLPAERVKLDGDTAQSVRALGERISGLLERS